MATSTAPTVLLNEAAVQVLEAEAERDIRNSIQERNLFSRKPQRPEAVAEYERKLLEAADLLGALSWARPPDGDGDEERRLVYVSDAAAQWLRRTHEGTVGFLADLYTGNEADLADSANEAYLAYVLDRVCQELEEASA